MPLGRAAAAPAGFLDFCRRSPGECPGSQDESDVATANRKATGLYWASVFSNRTGGRPQVHAPRTAPGAVDRAPGAVSSRWTQAAVEREPVVDTPRPSPVALSPIPPSADLLPLRRGSPRPLSTDFSFAQPGLATLSWSLTAPRARSERGPVMFGSPVADHPLVQWSQTFGPVDAARPEVSVSDRAPSSGFSAYAATEIVQLAAEPVARPGAAASLPAVLTLDRSQWALLNAVNRTINRRIRQVSDESAFGRADFWQSPTRDGAPGDCEDFVLAKRDALIKAGVPAGALSIAVVQTRRGETHAVLLVASVGGEVVLDNLSPWIQRWDKVDYRWRERQAPGKTFEWVDVAA